MAASLRASLLAFLLAGSLLPLAGLAWLEYRDLAGEHEADARAAQESAALAAALRADAAAARGEDLLAAAARGVDDAETLLLSREGEYVSSTGARGTWPAFAERIGDDLSGATDATHPGDDRPVDAAWARAPAADVAVVLVRPPAEPGLALRLPFLVLVAFLAGGVAVILAFVATAVLAPLRRLERASRRLARGEWATRLPESGPQEVQSLAQSFNTMAEALEAQRGRLDALLEERTRTLVDRDSDLDALRFTLAHEFREPLRSLLWMADDLLDRRLDDDARQAAEVIRRRILDLDAVFRDLLRYEDVSRRPAPLEDVALDEILRSAARVAREAGPLRLDADALPVVRANRDLLLVALTEVLRNVASHGRKEGEEAKARVRLEEDGPDVLLVIDDEGPGIPPRRREDALHLFQRMRRHVPGTGAGLALARRALQRHDGDLTLGEAPGGGARVLLRLPRAGPAPRSPLPERPPTRRF